MAGAENRELAERLGINVAPYEIKEWPYYYENQIMWSDIDPEDGSSPQIRIIRPELPDFSDPVVVLREMRKREDWPEFYHFLNQTMYPGTMLMPELDKAISDANLESVSVKYILDENHEGLLARAALEWLRSTPSSPRKSR